MLSTFHIKGIFSLTLMFLLNRFNEDKETTTNSNAM